MASARPGHRGRQRGGGRIWYTYRIGRSGEQITARTDGNCCDWCDVCMNNVYDAEGEHIEHYHVAGRGRLGKHYETPVDVC